MEVRIMDVKSLHVFEGNPRIATDEPGLAALAQSIREYGVMYPLLVMADGDDYAVVDGGRRLAACKLIGATEVPVLEMEADAKGGYLAAWTANYEREEVNWVDEAVWLQRFMGAGSLTESEAAGLLGRSAAYVRSRVAFFEWPAPLMEYAVTQPYRFSVMRVLARLGAADELVAALEWDRAVEPSYRQAVGYVDAVMARRVGAGGENGGDPEGQVGSSRMNECGLCGEGVDWQTARMLPVCAGCRERGRRELPGGEKS